MEPLSIAAIIAGGGLAIAAIPCLMAKWRLSMTKDWTETRGVVTRRDGSTEPGMPHYYPTFMYQDATGRWHRKTSGLGASLQPGPGRPVQVLYDPEAPERAVMNTFTQSGRIGYVIGGVIAVVVLLAAVMVYGITTITQEAEITGAQISMTVGRPAA